MNSKSRKSPDVSNTKHALNPHEKEKNMSPKDGESGLQLLQSLLGLRSPPRVESSEYRPPIFISIPSQTDKNKKEFPLTIAILDLLDLSHLSPERILTTHTFTNGVPLCWTKTTNHKMTTVFVTKQIVSLEHLLPLKRNLVFVSTGYEPDLREVKSMLGSLGLTPETSIVGIFDIEMLAREAAGNCGRYSLPAILRRLQCPMEKLGNDTEVMLRAMLLLLVESCRKEFVKTGDTIGKA
jgi:hypothetical protein